MKLYRKFKGGSWAVLLVLALVATIGRAEEAPLELDWEDLIPEAVREQVFAAMADPTVDHNSPNATQQSSAILTATRTDLNDKTVKLPGFVVPLYGDGKTVTEFLLVPYFGACIHVPPPPANQIVHVRYPAGMNADWVYDPIWVIGSIKATSIVTELAETGYGMKASDVVLYRE